MGCPEEWAQARRKNGRDVMGQLHLALIPANVWAPLSDCCPSAWQAQPSRGARPGSSSLRTAPSSWPPPLCLSSHTNPRLSTWLRCCTLSDSLPSPGFARGGLAETSNELKPSRLKTTQEGEKREPLFSHPAMGRMR